MLKVRKRPKLMLEPLRAVVAPTRKSFDDYLLSSLRV
jgi:hypothetical protein